MFQFFSEKPGSSLGALGSLLMQGSTIHPRKPIWPAFSSHALFLFYRKNITLTFKTKQGEPFR